jgi:hypothetical protein
VEVVVEENISENLAVFIEHGSPNACILEVIGFVGQLFEFPVQLLVIFAQMPVGHARFG